MTEPRFSVVRVRCRGDLCPMMCKCSIDHFNGIVEQARKREAELLVEIERLRADVLSVAGGGAVSYPFIGQVGNPNRAQPCARISQRRADETRAPCNSLTPRQRSCPP